MMQITISLKAARVNAGLTQSDVAQAMGKTKQTVVNWENGRCGIKYRDFMRLCELYGMPPEMVRLS